MNTLTREQRMRLHEAERSEQPTRNEIILSVADEGADWTEIGETLRYFRDIRLEEWRRQCDAIPGRMPFSGK